jgi:aspartate kinase
MGEDSIVVLKFGGSVLESQSSIEKICKIIEETARKGKQIVVVVSAMKGVTDDLLILSKQLGYGKDPSFLDELLSAGERIAAKNFCSSLKRLGIECIVVEPGSKYWPIMTDSNHQDANPDIQLTRSEVRKKIIPLLKKGVVPVVCGFLGVTKDGKVTTLGRGGSDTTAVILGSCLNAREVVLVKDVKGVYSTDPDLIEDPIPIGRLEASEAGILASSGAKFLHSKALRYADSNIRIRVTSLENLDSGTVIEGQIPELEVSAEREKIEMLTIILKEGDGFDVIRAIGEIISRKGGKIVSTAQLGNSVIVYCTELDGIEREVHSSLIVTGKAKALSSFKDVSMITVRGKALETRPGLIQRITQPLARNKINILGIVTIFSSIRLFVSSSSSNEAAELIKEALDDLA